MIFKQDPGRFAEVLMRDGYVVLRNIFTAEFRAFLESFVDGSRCGKAEEFGQGRIAGKKQQFLFDFPDDEAALEFRSGIARLTGIPEHRVTISERHLKQYDLAAPAYPAPHKDRGASRFSVGIPIQSAPGTSVCVFPALDRSANEADKAVFLTDALCPQLGDVYRNATFLNEEPGDMVVFEGSTLYHERVRPAGTAVLYIKLNGEGADPLGENIYGSELAPSKAA